MKRGCNFGLPPKIFDAEIVATNFQPGFVISAKETLAPHQVKAWDALSVTIQFAEQAENYTYEGESSDRASMSASRRQHLLTSFFRLTLLSDVTAGPNRIEFPLVRGMPYATGVYTGLTPFLFTGNAILAINDQDLPGIVTGNKLRVKLNNEQTVLVYAWPATGEEENTQSEDEYDDDEDEPDDDLQWKWDRNTVELVGPGQVKGNWSEHTHATMGACCKRFLITRVCV